MRMRNLKGVILLTLLVLLFWMGQGLTKDLLVNDSGFKSTDEVWGFIPDYADMAEGDPANWAWTKPGVTLGQYKTVDVPLFLNLSKEGDASAQELSTRTMKDELTRRLGMTVVDKDAEITVKGAVVDYHIVTGQMRFWFGLTAGKSFEELEVFVVDNKTGEIISKVRHQAHDDDIDDAIVETVSDVVTEWGGK